MFVCRSQSSFISSGVKTRSSFLLESTRLHTPCVRLRGLLLLGSVENAGLPYRNLLIPYHFYMANNGSCSAVLPVIRQYVFHHLNNDKNLVMGTKSQMDPSGRTMGALMWHAKSSARGILIKKTRQIGKFCKFCSIKTVNILILRSVFAATSNLNLQFYLGNSKAIAHNIFLKKMHTSTKTWGVLYPIFHQYKVGFSL